MTGSEVGFPEDLRNKGGLLLAKRQGDQEIKAISLTGEQLDKVIEVGAQAIPEAINILKGLVDIARIRSQAKSNVEIVEAETYRVVQTTKAEIDRIRQSREIIKTRGDVVSIGIRDITVALGALPDFDSQTRLALVEALTDILKLATASEA